MRQTQYRNRNIRTSKVPLKSQASAPTYSRALQQIRWVVKKVDQGELRSNGQSIIGDRVAVV